MLIKLDSIRNIYFDENLLWECIANNFWKYDHIFHSHWYRNASSDMVVSCVKKGHLDVPNFLSQIPVFLITTKECGYRITVDFVGRKEQYTIPQDRYKCKNVLSRLKEEYDNRYDEEITETIDIFGVYQNSISKNKNGHMNLSSVKPRIFVWVDKIMEYVKHDRQLFKLLCTQVILHEFAHALMDINIFEAHFNCIWQKYYPLKEESLANGLSLYLMKNVVSADDYRFLNFVCGNQPFEYALGTQYANERILSWAVKQWINIKSHGKHININIIEDWIKYITTNRIDELESEQLYLYEQELVSGSLYKYWKYATLKKEKIVFDEDGLCVKIIKDYHELNKKNITCDDMRNAFPDNLNSNFEVFIDYPIVNKFTDKKDPTQKRSIDDDKIIHCIDGDLAICDYWHPNDMENFIANAKGLGFNDIEIL